MTDLVALKAANVNRWAKAKLTRAAEFERFAAKIVANKARYQDVERRSGVHWVFVAVTHYREASLDFTKQLGQGDPLNKASIHVPAGRGPFLGPKAFEDAALDALVNCAPKAATNTDWSIGGVLTLLERYNGLAYANAGRPSPYIWSGTDQYTIGKVLLDHGPIEPVVDKQLGCAGLILAIVALDPTATFAAAAAAVPATPAMANAPSRVPAPLDARWLQASLNTLGATPVLNVDGVIGAGTRTAVKAFQSSKGLEVDGKPGPDTIAALRSAMAALTVSGPIVVPPIKVPAAGQVKPGLAPTFWGRVVALFKPKG